MSEIFSFTAAFIVVQIFKIIMFKKDKDYSGYDERQELIRGRAFRYGFLTLAFSLAAVVLWEECVGALPIEFSLLMMTCLMAGCLVVILYDIWKDAYWGIRQASGSNTAIVLMVAVMVMQYLGFRGHVKLGDVIVQAADEVTIVDSRTQADKATRLLSVHGSQTMMEMDIPCIVDVA